SSGVDPSSRAMNPPKYPPEEQRRGIQGTTVLVVSIDASGGVLDVEVEKSSGNRNLLLIEDRTAQSTLPEIPASRWTSLVADAEAASIAIHAVVLTDSGKPP
ncbi:MAG TPA: TonB family protein, partial [Bryobacteraceae bacterium]|nr:TonB family protein [Bryobacteraceae bacterium]